MRLINLLPLSVATAILLSLVIYILNIAVEKRNSYVYEVSKQELLDTNDNKFSLTDLNGKLYLLHISASWCAACQKDYTLLEKLRNEIQIPIIGVIIDRNTKTSLKSKYPYDLILYDIEFKIPTLLNSNILPETIIVGSNGIVQYRYLGVLNDKEVESVIIPAVKNKKIN